MATSDPTGQDFWPHPYEGGRAATAGLVRLRLYNFFLEKLIDHQQLETPWLPIDPGKNAFGRVNHLVSAERSHP